MRKTAALLGFLGFLSLAAFPLSALGRGEGVDDGFLFAASYMTLNNPFFVTLHESIEAAVNERGDRIVVLNPDYDQILQISQIEDLLSLGVDGLFLNPVDWKSIRPALEAAEAAGVPVFVVDAQVYDDNLVASTVVSDNREAGRLAARHLLEHRQGGNVVILDHPTNKPSIDRVDGFLEVLAEDPRFEVVSQLGAFGTLEGALPQMENALQANPEVDVVFGSNDPTILGAVAALVAAKRIDGTSIYSVDGSPEAKDLVRAGIITGTSAQSPLSIGRMAADIAYDYLDGKEVPTKLFVPVTLVTRENLGDFSIEGWQ